MVLTEKPKQPTVSFEPVKTIRLPESSPIEIELPTDTQPAQTAQSTVTTDSVQPTTQVRSVSEIAQDYPTLSGTPDNLACFNRIVVEYPERFTEDVREYNIKSLTAFGNACSTNIMRLRTPYVYLDSNSGRGGFFDGELAKSMH